MLVEEYDCRKHTEHITHTYHRVGHTEREMLDDVHPQHGTDAVTDATANELPVEKQSVEVVESPREITCLSQTVFHQYLSARQQDALYNG